MDKQLIINVGRQVGSGGLIIAKMLAKAFDCKFYDKEILNLAAQESGFSEKFFEKNDETKEYLRSRFHIHVPLLGESSFYSSDFSQEGLYKFQSEAIRKAAQEGRCVFVGRTADYILRDMKEKVDVFVTADLNDRIEAVAERHGLSRTEAKKYIQNKEATPDTTITTQERSGARRRAMTSASTPPSWAWSRRHSLSNNSSANVHEAYRYHQRHPWLLGRKVRTVPRRV